jgi:hypothetical protein
MEYVTAHAGTFLGSQSFLTAGMRGVVNEGPTSDSRRSSCHTHHIYSICFCGSIASHMRGAIDYPRRRAKRNNVLLSDTKMPSWPVEVKVRCWPRHAQPRKVRPCAICITLQATTTATAPLACFWQGRKRDPSRGLIGEKGGTPFALWRIFTNPVCNYQSHVRVRAEETFAPTYVTDVEAHRL